MKTALFFLFLFVVFFAQAQKIHKITIDFNEKTISELPRKDSIKIGDYYQIYVKNINMNLWDINYKSKDSTFTTPLKTPTFEDISLTNLTSLASSLNNFVFSSEIEELSNKEKKSVYKKEGFNNDNPCEELGDILKKQSGQLLSSVSDSLENAKIEYDLLRRNMNEYQLSLLTNLPELQSNYGYRYILDKVDEIKNMLLNIEDNLAINTMSYLSFIDNPKNKLCLSKNKGFQELHQKNIKFFNAVDAKIVALRDQLKADKIMALIKNVHFLKNGDNEYKSLPIQINGEISEVSLEFSPKKPEYNEQTYKMNFQFPKKDISNYWSIGASFFISDLSDERFSVLGEMQNDSTTVYSVIEEKKDDFELGVATMLRFGKKFKNSEYWGYHGSLGVGVNIGENIRPRFLLGPGISIGKKHTVAFDFGLIAGYVDERSNAVDLNTTYAIKPEQSTVTRLNFGTFFTFGYLFRL